MHRMGAQVYGLGANEPTCTPLATPLPIAQVIIVGASLSEPLSHKPIGAFQK